MSALMRSAAAGSIRADWSLQHCTGMEQACGEGANRGVHQGRVAVSTCHATELPVLEWPSAGQHQHTQTTQNPLETVLISPRAPCGWCIRSPWPYAAPGVAAWPFGSAKSPPKALVDNGRLFCLAYCRCRSQASALGPTLRLSRVWCVWLWLARGASCERPDSSGP